MAMARFILGVWLLLCSVLPATAEEVIRNFISDVTVNVDGSLDVRETITVSAEGKEIRRGILRDFPTSYIDKNGVQMRVGFDVVSVERDGQAENFTIENIRNGTRIKIGSADVFLEIGDHTYTIAYHATRLIGFFPEFDELYWNVTGNGWTFPIERASTIVRLPEGAEISQTSVYTGQQGFNEGDARVVSAKSNRFEAEITKRLESGEGFTVALSWQKGIVTLPTKAELQRYWLKDNLGYVGLAATLLLVPFYYLFAWFRVGRDPEKGTIVPLFHPPDGMGPAGVRYVYKAGYDDKAFAAAVVGLAVKGRMIIRNDGDEYTLAKKDGAGPTLTRAESALLRATPNSPLKLKQTNHTSVSYMQSALEGTLDDEYDGVMYLKNFKWFALGAVLSAGGLVGSGLLMPGDQGDAALVVGALGSIWWLVILAVGFSAVKGVFSGGGWLTRIRSLMGLIFLVPFVGAGIVIPSATLAADLWTFAMKVFVISAALLAGLNLLFYWLLKAPTQKGRGVLDQIEGFRMYMTTAEEKRLNALNPPEKTPQLFERYLPYAMALDCENEWNTKFASVLAAAAAAGATAGAFGGWYYGSGGFNSRSFGQDLGSSLTSSISSSGTAPGSSSGSSGGGSSGGGGGGGGGSGW
jgi:uncharacterized membrane protein YgcG